PSPRCPCCCRPLVPSSKARACALCSHGTIMNYTTLSEAFMFHPHPEHIFRWQSLLRHSRWHAIWLVPLLAASGARALPEDAAQQIDVDANSSEIDLDLGLVIYRGSNETPVRVSQGSMLITGTEIHMELRDGVLVRATAIGNPAHFQQQPEADKAIVYLSGQ